MNRVKRVIHALPSQTAPYTGAGVTAALLDTGFSLHPDLSGRLAAFKDFLSESRMPYDDSGHGTHVAGCLCGSGQCSGGLYSGVAPGCRILSCKVLNAKGEGCVDDMISGIRHVLDTRRLYRTRILSISVGVGRIEEKRSQQKLISWLEEAWDAGLLVIVAAGNKGPAPESISPLGTANRVICVGCHDGKKFPNRKNSCESYSGRGPAGNLLRKPDLVSPGTGVVSCSAFFRPTRSGKVLNAYAVKSGTSMSVPAVSGAAALLWEKYPSFTNEQVREKLLFGAQDLGEEWGKQGWGMLDVHRCLTG